MEAIGLLVALEARSCKEADAGAFLKAAPPLARDEKRTLKWIKIGPEKFGIFDTFANEAGRNAHLTDDFSHRFWRSLKPTIPPVAPAGPSCSRSTDHPAASNTTTFHSVAARQASNRQSRLVRELCG
jgi:hypothetical protein